MSKFSITEIMDGALTPREQVSAFKQKAIILPPWEGKDGLQVQYEPKRHPVMNRARYRDVVTEAGVERVTRITVGLQQLAVKRMTELVCGIPVKRVYKPDGERQKQVAQYLEAILQRNRVDSVNIERCNMLFAGCEVMTLWYGVKEANNLYGFESGLKLRCRNFSPMRGDELCPLFDETGDLAALSVGYTRRTAKNNVNYFDVYTADRHRAYSTEGGEWEVVTDEAISIMKIPAVYMYRSTPIWEHLSPTVYEIEWALSRNGNYLRKNSKPLFVLFADEAINYGNEKSENEEARSILQFPKGSSAQYVTWQQAVDNLKYYVSELRNMFFTQLQLPDWSYEKMSQQALSGESRKQLFIDAQLKVRDESGRLLEAFDREINVLKAFLKVALGDGWAKDIDALQVETIITPFSITDDKDTISNLVTGTGGKPIISQREAVEILGWSTDVDKTMAELADEETRDVMGGLSYE